MPMPLMLDFRLRECLIPSLSFFLYPFVERSATLMNLCFAHAGLRISHSLYDEVRNHVNLTSGEENCEPAVTISCVLPQLHREVLIILHSGEGESSIAPHLAVDKVCLSVAGWPLAFCAKLCVQNPFSKRISHNSASKLLPSLLLFIMYLLDISIWNRQPFFGLLCNSQQSYDSSLLFAYQLQPWNKSDLVLFRLLRTG